MPLAGDGRSSFKKAYLEPAGLKEEKTAFVYLAPRILKRAPRKEEIEAWRPWLMRQLQELNPEMVVALGKQAGEALGKLAYLTMPHPMPPLSTETRERSSGKPRCSEKTCLPRGLFAYATGDGSEKRYIAQSSRTMWRGDWFTA